MHGSTSALRSLSTRMLLAVGGSMLVVACAKQAPPPATPPPPEPVETTSARIPADNGERVVVADLDIDERIVDVCAIDLDNIDRAPTFAFDDDSLPSNDRDVLAEVATCFTTGPLSGRRLGLVGRADPRGESEYNLALGARRASSVASYVEQLGVPASRVSTTSRGKLDAVGTDEVGWARDRRVDLTLL